MIEPKFVDVPNGCDLLYFGRVYPFGSRSIAQMAYNLGLAHPEHDITNYESWAIGEEPEGQVKHGHQETNPQA